MKAAIIGNPVGHSLSPRLFAAAYPDSGFVYGKVNAKRWEDAWSSFNDCLDAANVTAPFKADACASADVRDDASTVCEASNVIVKRDGKVFAYNTDFLAVMKLLEAVVPCGPVVVFGCGGAGRAAAQAAARLGHEVTVADRDGLKAARFASGPAAPGRGSLTPLALAEIEKVKNAVEGSEAVVYALPVALDEIGLGDVPIFADKTVIEANYRNPSLREVSGRYISGLEWLYRQAQAGFPLMTGREPDLEAMRRALFKL